MKKNVISVYKLCSDNHVSIDFSLYSFVLKDFCSEASLVEGNPKGDVYSWSSKSILQVISNTQVKTTSITTTANWHRRLDHPSAPNHCYILNLLNISSSLHNTFYNTSIQSPAPLEYIYSDVWGDAPEVCMMFFNII